VHRGDDHRGEQDIAAPQACDVIDPSRQAAEARSHGAEAPTSGLTGRDGGRGQGMEVVQDATGHPRT
jgi:hypothetical protein